MGFVVKEKLPSVQMVRDLQTMQFLQLQLQNVGFCGSRNETGF